MLQTLLFIIVGNSVMGVLDMTMVWWGILFMTAMLASLTGLLLSQCLSSVVSIYITIPVLLIPQILLCGLVVNFSDLTPHSTTGNVPVIGNVIPSRWAYEALAVENYRDNAYERDFFDLDKVKYETQYYRYGPIYELQSANEHLKVDKANGQKADPEMLTLLRNELPHIAEVCGMKEYTGNFDYRSLYDYLYAAEQKMISVGNTATLAADAHMVDKDKALGRDGLLQLKRKSFNVQLQTQLAGYDAEKLCEVVDGYVVPRAGFVYLTPRTTNGNAPFYSSEKRLGGLTISTLWYNMGVMLLMSIVVTLMLLYDMPGRYVRK